MSNLEYSVTSGSVTRPYFSVITVCFNAINTLPGTYDSLFGQVGADYEWIVIDGASTDGTEEWIQKNKHLISAFISEKDAGIYDAMNKGVSLAKGDLLFFLNADDAFCDEFVLQDVARAFAENPTVTLLYGNAIYQSGKRKRQRRFHWVTRRNLVYGDLCHQAVFARRELFEKVGGFNLDYPINADYDWILRVFNSGESIKYIDRYIALFTEGGFHTRNPEEQRRERMIVKRKYSSQLGQFIGYWMLRIELKLRKLAGQKI